MNLRVLFLGLLIIVSCTTRHDNQPTDAEEQDNGDQGSILFKNEIIHNFSSPVAKDTFKIFVTGQSIIEGQVKFQIVNNDGLVILDEAFQSIGFLDYGLKGDATVNEKEEYLKGRINKFFHEDNFHQPAIDAKDTFDPDYTKREIWDDIIADHTAVGFYYLIGEEGGRHIAYSKRLRKVVLYYSCC